MMTKGPWKANCQGITVDYQQVRRHVDIILPAGIELGNAVDDSRAIAQVPAMVEVLPTLADAALSQYAAGLSRWEKRGRHDVVVATDAAAAGGIYTHLVDDHLLALARTIDKARAILRAVEGEK